MSEQIPMGQIRPPGGNGNGNGGGGGGGASQRRTANTGDASKNQIFSAPSRTSVQMYLEEELRHKPNHSHSMGKLPPKNLRTIVFRAIHDGNIEPHSRFDDLSEEARYIRTTQEGFLQDRQNSSSSKKKKKKLHGVFSSTAIADDQATRDRTSVECLGFRKPDWAMAERAENAPMIGTRLIACNTTLDIMYEFTKGSAETAGAFGSLDFKGSIGQAPFMLLHSDRFNDSKKCVPLVQLLIEYMGLKPPRLIVAITGSDSEEALQNIQQLRELLKNGLSEFTDVWFLTNGLSDGISSMVARLVADFRKSLPDSTAFLPVIGVVPWSDVPETQRQHILGTGQQPNASSAQNPMRVTYVPKDAASSWPDLDSNHTHFLFVRGGERQRMVSSQQDSAIEDVAAALRLRKDIQDALTEDLEYFIQKEWRTRFVDRGLFSAQNFQVLRSVPTHDGLQEVALNATMFPTGIMLPPGTCIIDFMDPATNAYLEFHVQKAYVATQSISRGKDDSNGVHNIVVVHRGTYGKNTSGGRRQSFLRGDKVRLRFDRRLMTKYPYVLEKGQKLWKKTKDSVFVLSSRHASSYLDDKNEFDHFLEHTTKVNSLCVMAGGGEDQSWRNNGESNFHESLVVAEMAIRNLETLAPLVLIEGTGGLTDVLAFAWRLLHDERAMSARLQRMQLEANVRQTFNIYERNEANRLVTRIFNVVAVAKKVSILSMESSSAEDLDKAMLAAIVLNLRPDFFSHEKEGIQEAGQPQQQQLQFVRAVNSRSGGDKQTLDERDADYYTVDRKQMFVQRYELHLNALRFAMSFDRIEEAEIELGKAKEAWRQMETIWHSLRDVQKRKRKSVTSSEEQYDELSREDEKLNWWWEQTPSQLDLERTLGQGRLLLSFHEQVELALEWALDENKIEQVKLLKSEVTDFPRFLYGRKKCRAAEGLGTSLAEFYEYERHADVRYYLEPVLKFIKDPPSFPPHNPHVKNEVGPDGSILDNVPEVNNVRMRRIWELVLCLMYGTDREPDLHDREEPFFHEKKNFLLSPRKWEMTKDGKYVRRRTDAWEEGKIDPSRDRTLESIWELICQKRDPGSNHYNPPHAELLAHQEMMIWAVLFNRFDMAVYFWEEGGHAIPNALLASQLFWGMANHPELLSRGRMSDRVQKMLDMSEKFEQYAIGVLSLCHDTSADWTQDVLVATLKPYDWMRNGRGEFDDSLELAHLANNKNFISHAACQAVIDRKWRGGRTHAEKHTVDGAYLESNIFQRFIHKFTAPRVKFYIESIFFVFLLLLHSYVVLAVMEDYPSIYEYVLALWFAVLVLEEIRQTFDNGFALIYFLRWWNDTWNRVDLVMYCLFFVTFGLRLAVADNDGDMAPYYSKDNWNDVIRALYGINLMLVYMRSFRYFSASPTMGPKIVILMELVVSLKQYLILIFMFIIAYGIFMQAILRPSGGIDWTTVRDVLYRPYFQIYGELALEDINDESQCVGLRTFTSCPNIFSSLFVPVITGFYLIVTSLMVLNMLIADFTITFETVRDESDKVYRMQALELLDEFDGKPLLPPPLSLFNILYRFFFRTIPTLYSYIKYTYFVKYNGDDDTGHYTSTAQMEEEQLIEDFQDRVCDRYLEELRSSVVDSLYERVCRIENEMRQAKTELNFFKGKSYSSSMRRERPAPAIVGVSGDGQPHDGGSTNLRVPSVTVVEAIKMMQDRRMSSLPALRYPVDDHNGAIVDVDTLCILRGPEHDSLCSMFQPIARACELDVRICDCKQGTLCIRENFSCRMRKQPEHGDAMICDPDAGEQPNPFPNPIPARRPQDWYARDWPFHENWEGQGNTRGPLPHLGVNRYKLHIVTRWKRDNTGMPIDRAGKRLLEFVAIKRDKDDNMWAIPELHIDEYGYDYDESNDDNFESPVYRFAFHAKNFKSDVTAPQRESVMEAVKDMFFKVPDSPYDSQKYPFQGLEIYNGFMDDERNTANAWVMAEVIVNHDENEVLDAFEMNTTISERAMKRPHDVPAEVAWLTMHRDLDLCGEQEELIKHVAVLHNAYW